MFKRRLLVIVFLVLALVFVGCSSDDNDEITTYSIETEVSEGKGKIELEPNKDKYEKYDEVIIKAVAGDNYEFKEWGGNLDGNTNPYKNFIVEKNSRIVAKFSEQESSGFSLIHLESNINDSNINNSNIKSSKDISYSLSMNSYNENNYDNKFSLGDLKASKSFYFILVNNGSNPIYDINLESNNEKFVVSPSHIEILSPSEETNYWPIIEVNILHGKALDGIGYTKLMDMGENNDNLVITGKDINEDEKELITYSVNFSVNALVADIKLYDDSNLIDFKEDIYSTRLVSSLGGLGTLYAYKLNSPEPEIKNIGNIDIKIELYDNNTAKLLETIEIKSNEKKVISNTEYNAIGINSNNTIINHNKFNIGKDGKAYFFISK